MKKLLLLWITFLILVTCLYGEKKPYIIVSVRGLDNDYYRDVMKGADLFAGSIGASDRVIKLFNGGNSEKQIRDFQLTLEKTGKNAIAYFDPNESATVSILAQIATQNHIYFATQWNKPENVWPWDYNPYWVVHSTPNSVSDGYLIARTMFQSMGGKGKILAINGRPGNSTARDRFKGLKKALQEYPGIRLLESKPANWNRAEAAMLTMSWFSKYSGIDGIWAGNDEMALGALEIMQEMGRAGKVKICGVDATSDAIHAIIAGKMLCTVSPDPHWQSGMSLSFAYHAYQGKLKPAELPEEKRAFFIQSRLITQKNAGKYLDEYTNGSPAYNYDDLWQGKWSGGIR